MMTVVVFVLVSPRFRVDKNSEYRHTIQGYQTPGVQRYILIDHRPHTVGSGRYQLHSTSTCLIR